MMGSFVANGIIANVKSTFSVKRAGDRNRDRNRILGHRHETYTNNMICNMLHM